MSISHDISWLNPFTKIAADYLQILTRAQQRLKTLVPVPIVSTQMLHGDDESKSSDHDGVASLGGRAHGQFGYGKRKNAMIQGSIEPPSCSAHDTTWSRPC
jgi:hypothetical protein